MGYAIVNSHALFYYILYFITYYYVITIIAIRKSLSAFFLKKDSRVI